MRFDKLISDHPSYQDALTNMARLKSLVELAMTQSRITVQFKFPNDSQVSNTLDPSCRFYRGRNAF